MRDAGEYDVIVCGCGTSGFPAAVAAARRGMRVCAIEKYGGPGGTMTYLGSNSVDEFINPHKKGDRFVIRGIAWEFVLRLRDMGYADVPDMDAPFRAHQQYGVKVNPVAAAALMDRMLLEAGVTLMYCRAVADAVTRETPDGKTVTSLLVTTDEGLARVSAKVYIDATGDGNVCAMVGAAYEAGDGTGGLQPGTLRYYLSGGIGQDGAEKARLAFDRALKTGELTDNDLCWYGGDAAALLRMNGDNRNQMTRAFDPAGDSRTAEEIASRGRMLRFMEALRGTGTQVASLAPEIASRERRRILCDGYLTGEDYLSCRRFPDAVCYSYWFVDIHRETEFVSGHVYMNSPETPCVPLSCMTVKGFDDLLVTGRAVSADREASSALRVKASCMAMGEAAGCAAARAVKENVPVRCADIGAIRRDLAENGAIVPGIDR